MCGICGVISPDIDISKRELTVSVMNESIFHRGPDEDGFFSDTFGTLAMRRLSIIDLHTGKQPLYSDCGRYLIFFNGEIYNYLELKKILISKGVLFKTNSDTEVVVNLYKRYGKSMLRDLKGMFAFCIYDLETHKYFLARDRFGEKPLYYYHDGRQFIFSSEMNSLLSAKLFRPKLNHKQLPTYLQLGFVPEPETLVEKVFVLPQASYMEVSKDISVSVYRYASIDYQPDASIQTMEQAVDFIKPYFEQSVKRQLISDVPVGAFLSGGIDSSSVVATMAKLSAKPVKTFTVKFQTKGYDESHIARRVAERWNTEHYEILVENAQFTEDQFWRILRHVGLPFPDSSAIPTDIVTKEISRFVKVALSGDGGDEVFGGYTVFDWLAKVKKISTVPSFLRHGFIGLLNGLNQTILNNNKIRQVSKALKIADLPLEKMIQETHSLMDTQEINKFFKLVSQSSFASNELIRSEDSLLRNAMRYRVMYDLPLDMLIKVDRMSMANSLEVRAPFLDADLFDASCKLPEQFLRAKGVGKLVIRKMMEHDLPNEVFNHPKSGFSIPLHDFRNSAFCTLAEMLLQKDYMRELFYDNAIKEILSEGLVGSKNTASGSVYRKTHQLWSLMMLSGWIQMYNIQL